MEDTGVKMRRRRYPLHLMRSMALLPLRQDFHFPFLLRHHSPRRKTGVSIVASRRIVTVSVDE